AVVDGSGIRVADGAGEALGPAPARLGPGSGRLVESAGPGGRDPPCAEEGAVEEARAVVRDDEPTVPVCAGRTLRVDRRARRAVRGLAEPGALVERSQRRGQLVHLLPARGPEEAADPRGERPDPESECAPEGRPGEGAGEAGECGGPVRGRRGRERDDGESDGDPVLGEADRRAGGLPGP